MSSLGFMCFRFPNICARRLFSDGRPGGALSTHGAACGRKIAIARDQERRCREVDWIVSHFLRWLAAALLAGNKRFAVALTFGILLALSSFASASWAAQKAAREFGHSLNPH